MRRKQTTVFSCVLGCLLASAAWAAEPADDEAIGQGPWVTAIAPVGDDNTYAVATAEGLLLRESTVYLISGDAPQTMQPLYQHAAGAWAVTASADGKRIASADYRGNLVVYDVAAQQATTHEGALERWTRALAFSPDGSMLVGGNEAGKIVVWSLEKGAAAQTAELDAHAVMDVAFAPDGQQLAVTDGGGHLHLLKWPSLEEAGKAEISSEAAWSVAFVGDGLLVGSADNRVYRLDGAGQSPAATEVAKATDWITDLAVSEGSLVAAAQLGGAVIMLDAGGKAVGPPVAAPSGVWSLCWAGNGKLLVGTRKHGVRVLQQSWAWAEPAELMLTAETIEPPAATEPEDKPADEKPAEEKPADEKPADEKPADEKPAEEKPAEEKPAEEKPADEKPADEKPADEKPADEKPADEKPADEA